MYSYSLFLNAHGILEKFQSGIKPLHSTESALLTVFNDSFLATDTGDRAILVLLDLTAAFDTVDHSILISRLDHCVGIRDTALKWFWSCWREFSLSALLVINRPVHLFHM